MKSSQLFLPKLSTATALILGLALFKFILHLATSGSYGYFRDEFYYMAAGEHLQWGYLEFPPLIAVVSAFSRWLLGDSLLAIRFFPALAGAGIVLVSGLMARELGGKAFAQGLAALAALAAPIFLTMNSMLTMDSFDELWWILAAYLVIRILKGGSPRLWLAFGLVAGLGLFTKLTFLSFGGALVLGLLLTPARRYFTSRWIWLGGLIALVFLVPYVAWEAANGFPTLEFWKVYAAGKTYPVTPPEFLLQQILITQPFALPLWIAGLLYYLFSRPGRPFRPLGIAYIVLFGVLMAAQAKSYFLAPAYPMLFAAGSVWLESATALRRRWVRPAFVTVFTLTSLAVAPLGLPVLPVETFIRYSNLTGGAENSVKTERLETAQLPQQFADRFGWENLTAVVNRVYQGLPADERAKACIFGGNYGEADSIRFFGRAYGLPPVISGHNQHFLWGPGSCSGEVMILVGVPTEYLTPIFETVETVDTARCQYCMPYESNLPILVARHLRVPIQEFWPRVRNYG